MALMQTSLRQVRQILEDDGATMLSWMMAWKNDRERILIKDTEMAELLIYLILKRY